MLRRDFLRSASALGAAALFGVDGRDAEAGRRLRGGSMLDGSAAACPIDTIVVCMMENRSFDHYLGWLGTDETYREAGRSRYGRRFRVDGETIYRATRFEVAAHGPPEALDSAKYVVLNLALGGVYPAAVNGVKAPRLGLPDATLPRIERGEARVLVDWVRATR